MTRHRWGICAVALLGVVGLAGCPSSDLFNDKAAKVAGPAEDHFVAGSIEVVSARAQGVLQQLNVAVVAAPAGEDVCLHCTTAAGKHFDLILERSAVNGAQYTDLRMEWQGQADDELAGVFLGGMEVLISR